MPPPLLDDVRLSQSENEMPRKTASRRVSIFKHHTLVAVDESDCLDTDSNEEEEEEEDITPVLHPQAQSPQISLDTPYDSSNVEVDSSELSDLSDTAEVDFGSHSLESVRIRSSSPANSGEDVEAAVPQNATGAKDGRILKHEVDVRLPSTFFSHEAVAGVQTSQQVKPASQRRDFAPPLPSSTEEVAVRDLREHYNGTSGTGISLEDKDYTEFELLDFSIYLPNNKYHPFAMRGLQFLGARVGNTKYLFDGILSFGDKHHYVQGVPFKLRSIGNYGPDLHDVDSQIWIESERNLGSNTFYRLASPSAEYRRFHDEFLWLANLAKHFVDYSLASEHPLVLNDFRGDFCQWLQKTHSQSSAFTSWLAQYNSQDFRSAVSVNINFLYSESMGIDRDLESHPIWKEVMTKDFVPFQKIEEKNTIVTPYVYDCFKDIRFGQYLKALPSQLTGMPAGPAPIHSQSNTVSAPSNEFPIERKRFMDSIKAGDVLSVTTDGSNSAWKDEISRWKAADDCWYVYIQKVYNIADRETTFDAIWLYKPSDTSCAKMKYPYPNELFMSDNCTCSSPKIRVDEVLGIVQIRWQTQPSETDSSSFIRQTYLENEKFVTLEEGHKTCKHFRAKHDVSLSTPQPGFPIGTTVLVPPKGRTKHGLEPYEIDSYTMDGVKHFAILRRLLRRRDIDGTGEKNELVYTDNMEKMAVHKVQRTCLVRFYSEFDVKNKLLQPPYNRNGNGNAFYISTRLEEINDTKSLRPIHTNMPQSLIQGFKPLEPIARRVLNGLGLFCGGGSFDRGLEEGGAVRNKWAADIDQNAIHTYNANVDETEPTKLFYGSVNDMLAQAIKGNPRNSDLIPLPGDVDFISAGSPCQGFSSLNNQPNNEKGLRNQSLVASVASYVDHYRPKYGILENVLSMAQKGDGRDEDIMSQLICTIVGLGYQVRLCVLDAWSCGSPQSRGRLFLTFAAPGLTPMEHPELSHSHPPNVNSRSLGKLANGQAFGSRRSGPTPFEWVTVEESLADLPDLGDGATYQCITRPDHVMAGSLTEQLRGRVEVIPTQPRGMSFRKAWNGGQGVMTLEERTLFPPVLRKDGIMASMHKPTSKSYSRVDPKAVFPCMTVRLNVADAVMGRALHWDQNRMLTAMEGRRIQGVPDHEVILGTASEAWKILGNSVNRNVSLAWGLSLREAWLANGPVIYGTTSTASTAGATTATLAFVNRGAVNSDEPAKSSPRNRIIQTSTRQGPLSRRPAPAHYQSASSLDDERNLADSTHCPSTSPAPALATHPSEKQASTASSTGSASAGEKNERPSKRRFDAYQEDLVLPKEKVERHNGTPGASMAYRVSSMEDRGRHTRSESNTTQNSGVANKLQTITKKSDQLVDSNLLYDNDESINDNSNSKVQSGTRPSSKLSKPHSRSSPKQKISDISKHPSKPRYRSPVFITLVSDDEDVDLVLQQQLAVRAAARKEREKKEAERRERVKRDAERREKERRQSGEEKEDGGKVKKYVPVDNAEFEAYEMTNRYLARSAGRPK
ncbi:hypothetical protein VTL71DRAFT_11767 [Oculimacula yallundae]|uniref:DNA (cytosine-5-)-methyltransferase n=1 Tax=Oculimacula yallundae TaxID=86028 RepID=A0ABR4CTL7_9HELO